MGTRGRSKASPLLVLFAFGDGLQERRSEDQYPEDGIGIPADEMDSGLEFGFRRLHTLSCQLPTVDFGEGSDRRRAACGCGAICEAPPTRFDHFAHRYARCDELL